MTASMTALLVMSDRPKDHVLLDPRQQMRFAGKNLLQRYL
jgi:hypothetical protein